MTFQSHPWHSTFRTLINTAPPPHPLSVCLSPPLSCCLSPVSVSVAPTVPPSLPPSITVHTIAALSAFSLIVKYDSCRAVSLGKTTEFEMFTSHFFVLISPFLHSFSHFTSLLADFVVMTNRYRHHGDCSARTQRDNRNCFPSEKLYNIISNTV